MKTLALVLALTLASCGNYRQCPGNPRCLCGYVEGQQHEQVLKCAPPIRRPR
jgi:hypothetical protein